MDAVSLVEERAVKRWPGKKITYSDKLSPSYDWAIKQAARAWNQGSGVKIKLKPAPKGKRGDVIIRRGPTSGSAGQATLGAAKNAYVHLSTSYPKKLTRDDWIMTSVLIAHEFGHVLGVGHLSSATKQLLMEPFIPQEGAVGDGRMSCRWVEKKDAKAAIRLYGGRVDLAPKTCLVEPLAPALRNVEATGGFGSGPVSLTWDVPAGMPAQSRIYVQVNQSGDCGGGWFVDFHQLPATATSWTDQAGLHLDSDYCYQVVALNYWDGGAAPYTTVR